MQESESKLQEEDRNRYNILIKAATEVFERVMSNISNLYSRNMTFIGVILTTFPIILSLVLFLRQIGLQFSNVDRGLLFLFGVFWLISLIISFPLAVPTKFKDLRILEEDKFDELKSMSEKELFIEILSSLKEAYDFNENKYKMRIKQFRYAFYSFIISIVIFITFVTKNLF